MRNRYSSAIFLLISLMFLSCKKEKHPSILTTGYKIEIISGNNQTDTIGKYLKDTILIKATKNGVLLKNQLIRIITTGCEQNSTTDIDFDYYHPGFVKYRWLLQGTSTQQSLKVILLDSLRNKVDSTTVNATGIVATNGWYLCSCMPLLPTSFVKLKSGRLLASLEDFQYPVYYSDDNAVTWHRFKTLPNLPAGNYVSKLLVTPDGDLFLAAINAGIYYSKDEGLSWQLRVNGITDSRGVWDMSFTRGGILSYTNYYGNVFLTKDKGLNWYSSTGLDPGVLYQNVTEQINGDLFMLDNAGSMYKSTDKGVTWQLFITNVTSTVQSLTIDDDGTIYLFVNNSNTELFKSADFGKSWTKIFSVPPYLPWQEVIQPITKLNGVYYLFGPPNGFVETTDFVNFKNIIPFQLGFPLNYVFNAKGNLVIDSFNNGVYYYIH